MRLRTYIAVPKVPIARSRDNALIWKSMKNREHVALLQTWELWGVSLIIRPEEEKPKQSDVG